MRIYFCLVAVATCVQVSVFATAYLVTSNADTNTSGTFRYALNNAVSGDVIQFQTGIGTIALTSNLPVITQNNLEISAPATQVIDGGGSYRVFAIGNNSESPTVSISNISVVNGLAQGGSGGYTYYGGGGGGGLGAGGGFFIKGDVTLDSILISDCQAVGGSGGNSGDVSSTQNSGSGGGGASFSTASANGENAFPISQGGNGGGDGGGVGATTTNQSGGDATEISGGGGGAAPGSATPGAVGGNGGVGLYGGAGGGAGSGATASYAGGNGGNAGFGAGGGGAGKGGVTPIPIGGSGGILGGNGGSTDLSLAPYFVGAAGGGGAGVGGAVFVYQGSSLTLSGAPSISDGTVTGGNAGTTPSSSQNGSPGTGFAPGIFLDQGATLTLQGTFDTGVTIDSYSSRVDGGVTLASGVVNLSGTNTYAGGTTLLGGTLGITSAANIGGSGASITFSGGGLSVGGSVTLSGIYSITDNSTLSTSTGNTTTVTSTITGSSGKTLTLSGAGANSLSGVVVNGSDSFTISGAIGGSQLLTKTGTGTLVLASASTYTGGTTLSSGILNIQNSSALGSGSASVTSGAQLKVQGGITVSNALTLNGAGGGTGALLNVSGSNTYSGAITLGAATTIGSTSGTLTLSNTNAISGTYNLTFAGSGNTTVSGIIATSTGTLTKNGSGTLTLSGANTYSGPTSLSAGTITLNANAGLGTSTLTMAADTIFSLGSGVSASNNVVLTGTFGHTYTITVPSGSATLSGVLSNGFFTKSGSGTLTLTNINTYSTGTTVSAGALNIQNAKALGGGPVTVSSGAQLQLQGGITTNPLSSNSLSLNGTGISSTGALLNVSGNNTYSRTVSLAADASIGSTSGTLTLNNSSAISGAHNLTFVGAGNTTVSGIIATTAHTLTQSGSGTLTLSGTNTYSGGTTISSGILNIRNSSGLGSGSASVTSGAQLQLQGGISVTNGLTLNGTGGGTGALLNVSGNNTYSGAITLGLDTTIGSSLGTMTLGAINGGHNLIFTGAGGITLGNGIGGSTPITTLNVSAGTLSTAGYNINTTGSVTVAGTMSITSGSSHSTVPAITLSGSGIVNFNDGSATITPTSGTSITASGTGADAVNINASVTTSTSGQLGHIGASGIGNAVGTVAVAGSSNLTVGATNIYANQLTLASGTTLTVSNNSSVISAPIEALFANNGTVHTSVSWTPLSTIGISGMPIGTLSISDGQTLTMAHDIYATNTNMGNASILTINADNLIVGGAIDGTGGILNINNSGFTVNESIGSNASLGAVNIASGIAYSNNNSISAETMTVNGTLKGTGTINGTITVSSGGTISPGNSIGTMTVENLALDSGGTTNIEINAGGESSKIVVMGIATLDGTLQIVQDVGNYSTHRTYAILQGTYTGAFASLHGVSPTYFELRYDPGFVYLQYNAPISTASLSGNSANIANYLNANATFSTLAYFNGLSDAELQNAMNAISPSRNGNGTYITQMNAFSASSALTGHIKSVREQESDVIAFLADASNKTMAPDKKGKFSGWVTGFGEIAHQSGTSQTPSFGYGTGALLVGFDYKDMCGIALGYGYTHFNEAHHAGHGNINDYLIALYGNIFIGDLYFSPTFWGSFSQTHNVRNVSFTGFSEIAKANIYAWQINPHIEIGYDIPVSKIEITPFTSLDWPISWQRGYTETGAAPFNTSQPATTSSMVRSETGLRFLERWNYSWGAFLLKEKASYAFEKPFGTSNITAAFVGTPGAFTVTALTQNLNLGVVAIDLIAIIGKKAPVSVSLGYEGEFGANYCGNQLMLTLRKTF